MAFQSIIYAIGYIDGIGWRYLKGGRTVTLVRSQIIPEALSSMTGNEFVDKTPEKRNLSKDHWSTRLSEEVRVAVQAWAEKQVDKPSLSEAIERLVETGLSD
jgi:hypothetical protein